VGWTQAGPIFWLLGRVRSNPSTSRLEALVFDGEACHHLLMSSPQGQSAPDPARVTSWLGSVRPRAPLPAAEADALRQRGLEEARAGHPGLATLYLASAMGQERQPPAQRQLEAWEVYTEAMQARKAAFGEGAPSRVRRAVEALPQTAERDRLLQRLTAEK
jgi:hypothetical protein